jgi:hypothetical protein
MESCFNVSGGSDFLALAGESADQIFELKIVSKLDANLTPALACSGDRNSTTNCVADAAFQVRGVQLLRCNLPWRTPSRHRLVDQDFGLTHRHPTLLNLFCQGFRVGSIINARA